MPPPGRGVTLYPGLNVQSNGFFIGSDVTGTQQAHGNFDDMATYNVQLDSNTIGETYSGMYIYYYLNPADAMAWIQQAPSQPETAPTFQAITGPGYLVAVSTNTSCTYGTDEYAVWFVTNGMRYSQRDPGNKRRESELHHHRRVKRRALRCFTPLPN